MADLITMYNETIDQSQPLEIFDPEHTWKRSLLENYTAREMLVPIFDNGELVYNLPPLEEIRDHCAREMATMWKEVLRFENPHEYYVDLSQDLWDLKTELISKFIKGNKTTE